MYFFPPSQNVVTLFFVSMPSCQLFLAAGAHQEKCCPQYQNGEREVSCLKASNPRRVWQKSRNHFKQVVEKDTVTNC